MSITPRSDRLRALDAAFLYVESPRTPMHQASIGIFEGAALRDRRGRIRLRAVREEVQHRLDLVPRLRQRPLTSSFLLRAPVWVDDEGFDISNHVRVVSLPAPGTEEQLAQLCADLMAVPLDRGRPLWEIWLVDGLASGDVALFEKLHHSVADGMAGVELATILLDWKRHPAAHHPPSGWHAAPHPHGPRLVTEDVAGKAGLPWRLAAHELAEARHPATLLHRAGEVIEAVGSVLNPLSIAPPSPLNVQIGRRRKLVLVRRQMEELRQIEHHFGVTLNDLLLAAVGGGLHRLLASRGERTDGHSVQVMVPVGSDHGADRRLGNQVSAMFVRVPIGSSGAVTRLRAVARAAAACKRMHQPLAGSLLLRGLELLPQPALVGIAALVHRQPFMNLVVTNVPGPDFPLYALESKMREAFPIVPLAGNLSIGIAALSYDGQLTITALVDADVWPDAGELGSGIERAFDEMAAAAGVGGAGGTAERIVPIRRAPASGGG